MKKYLSPSFLFLPCYLLSWLVLIMVISFGSRQAVAQSVTFPSKPSVDSFYVDEANILNPEAGKAINEICATLFREQQVPIIVVVIPSLMAHNAGGYTIERYAFELFNHWGIGSRQRNYGMLLLISVGDRKARIELGSAWGHSYNLKAQEVMDKLIIPQFKQGNYSEGILAGVRGMDAMARGLELPKPKPPWWVLPLALGLLGLVIAVIVSLFKQGKKGWGWALIALLGAVLFFLLRAAASSRGSGGAFGGGTSGGGGATGSW